MFSCVGNISRRTFSRFSGHRGRGKSHPTTTENYSFPNIQTWIAILTQDCLNCQTSKSMPNLLMALQQPFLEVSPYFNHRFSMETKGPISPSLNGHFYVYVIVDAFTHYVVLYPSPKKMPQMHSLCYLNTGLSNLEYQAF